MFFRFVFIIAVAFFLSACATKKSRSDESFEGKNNNAPAGVAKNESYGPDPMFGPEEPPVKKEKISGKGLMLILGPGLARTLSFVGVLKELEKDEVQIGAIYGSEFGAVIAAMFANSNANKLEWELFKFKKTDFIDKNMFGMSKESSDGKKFEAFLDKVFQKRQLEQFSRQALIGLGTTGSGFEKLAIISKGDAKQIVRASLGIPGIMKPASINGTKAYSGSLYNPVPAKKLKELYEMKTLCVDAVGTGDDFKIEDQEGEYLSSIMKSVSSLAKEGNFACDESITVDVNGIHYLDFDSRADLIERGAEAARKFLDKR